MDISTKCLGKMPGPLGLHHSLGLGFPHSYKVELNVDQSAGTLCTGTTPPPICLPSREADSKQDKQVTPRVKWKLASIGEKTGEKRMQFETKWSKASLKKYHLRKVVMEVREEPTQASAERGFGRASGQCKGPEAETCQHLQVWKGGQWGWRRGDEGRLRALWPWKSLAAMPSQLGRALTEVRPEADTNAPYLL